jgi:hypothetical protein
MKFVVDKNGTRVGFSTNTSVFSLFVIMHPVLHTYIHLHVYLATKTSWRSQGTIQRATPFLEIGEHWTEKNLTFSSG